MKDLLDSCIAEIVTALDRFPWEQRVAYADWLAQTYYYVRHATRLVATAAARIAPDDGGDGDEEVPEPVLGGSLRDEARQARLALRDLGGLGASVETFPEHASTRMFYETQYYKIQQQNPIALLGYELPLEGLGPACGRRLAERVTAAHGERCCSFLRFHGEEGVARFEKRLSLFARLDHEDSRLVEENARQTAYAYRMMLLDIRYRIDFLPRSRMELARSA